MNERLKVATRLLAGTRAWGNGVQNEVRFVLGAATMLIAAEEELTTEEAMKVPCVCGHVPFFHEESGTHPCRFPDCDCETFTPNMKKAE